MGVPFAPALHLQLERSSGSRDSDMQLLRSLVDYVSFCAFSKLYQTHAPDDILIMIVFCSVVFNQFQFYAQNYLFSACFAPYINSVPTGHQMVTFHFV